MVLLNASKMARNSAKLVAKETCGGSAKKCGLSPTVGWVLSSNPYKLRATNTLAFQLVCIPNRSMKVQKVGQAMFSHNRISYGQYDDNTWPQPQPQPQPQQQRQPKDAMMTLDSLQRIEIAEALQRDLAPAEFPAFVFNALLEYTQRYKTRRTPSIVTPAPTVSSAFMSAGSTGVPRPATTMQDPLFSTRGAGMTRGVATLDPLFLSTDVARGPTTQGPQRSPHPAWVMDRSTSGSCLSTNPPVALRYIPLHDLRADPAVAVDVSQRGVAPWGVSGQTNLDAVPFGFYDSHNITGASYAPVPATGSTHPPTTSSTADDTGAHVQPVTLSYDLRRSSNHPFVWASNTEAAATATVAPAPTAPAAPAATAPAATTKPTEATVQLTAAAEPMLTQAEVEAVLRAREADDTRMTLTRPPSRIAHTAEQRYAEERDCFNDNMHVIVHVDGRPTDLTTGEANLMAVVQQPDQQPTIEVSYVDDTALFADDDGMGDAMAEMPTDGLDNTHSPAFFRGVTTMSPTNAASAAATATTTATTAEEDAARAARALRKRQKRQEAKAREAARLAEEEAAAAKRTAELRARKRKRQQAEAAATAAEGASASASASVTDNNNNTTAPTDPKGITLAFLRGHLQGTTPVYTKDDKDALDAVMLTINATVADALRDGAVTDADLIELFTKETFPQQEMRRRLYNATMSRQRRQTHRSETAASASANNTPQPTPPTSPRTKHAKRNNDDDGDDDDYELVGSTSNTAATAVYTFGDISADPRDVPFVVTRPADEVYRMSEAAIANVAAIPERTLRTPAVPEGLFTKAAAAALAAAL